MIHRPGWIGSTAMNVELSRDGTEHFARSSQLVKDAPEGPVVSHILFGKANPIFSFKIIALTNCGAN